MEVGRRKTFKRFYTRKNYWNKFQVNNKIKIKVKRENLNACGFYNIKIK